MRRSIDYYRSIIRSFNQRKSAREGESILLSRFTQSAKECSGGDDKLARQVADKLLGSPPATAVPLAKQKRSNLVRLRRFLSAIPRSVGRRRKRIKQATPIEAAKTNFIEISIDEVEALVSSAFSPHRSYSENIARLQRYRVAAPSDVPADPASREYREYQLRLYERLSGQSYDPPKTERANGLTLADALKNPFPYATQDAAVVGTYLAAVGHVVGVIGRRPASRILEFGSGWGHTTLALARSGYRVTAIDIEPMFIDLIDTLAAREGCVIETHCAPFEDFPNSGGGFDVILFFECFHHCFDHAALLPKLRSSLNPGGRILLCSEPIGAETVPYPWGIRLDGHSLWAIRTHGWMELGFKEDYIVQLFVNGGFRLTKHQCAFAGEAGIIFEFEMQREDCGGNPSR